MAEVRKIPNKFTHRRRTIITIRYFYVELPSVIGTVGIIIGPYLYTLLF